jgi:hypothetical protein
MTSGALGLTLYGTEGNPAQKGLPGVDSVPTAIDTAAIGGHGVATRIAEAIPYAGAVVSAGVFNYDLKNALEKAGC